MEGFPESEPISPAELLALNCDILVPAALENTIHADNATTARENRCRGCLSTSDARG